MNLDLFESLKHFSSTIRFVKLVFNIETMAKRTAVSVDPRRDSRLWSEVIKTEQSFIRRYPTSQELQAAKKNDDITDIRKITKQLELCSADYLWTTEDASPVSITAPTPAPEKCAMTQLAEGVGDVETTFMRRRPDPSDGARRAATEQHPTIAPWQMYVDCSYWNKDALNRWNALQRTHVLQMPEVKQLRRVEPTISGPHAGSVVAWRRNEVPISQWEASKRAEALFEAKKVAAAVEASVSKVALAALLDKAMRVSGSYPSPQRAKWFER